MHVQDVTYLFFAAPLIIMGLGGLLCASRLVRWNASFQEEGAMERPEVRATQGPVGFRVFASTALVLGLLTVVVAFTGPF